MEDLLDIEGQIESAMSAFRSKVEALSSITDRNLKKSSILEAKKARTEAHGTIAKLRAAVRSTQNKTDKTLYEKKRVAFDEELKALTELLTEASAPPAGGGRRRRGQAPPPDAEVDGNSLQTTQQVFSEIHNVQDKTYALAQKTLRVGHNAEQISQGTLLTLQKQNELIIQADDALDGLDSNLKRASRQVSAIARKMAGDRCFLCLFCVLLIALAFLIFWKIYSGRLDKKDSGGQSPTVTQPTAPPEVTLLRFALRTA